MMIENNHIRMIESGGNTTNQSYSHTEIITVDLVSTLDKRLRHNGNNKKMLGVNDDS